MTPAWVHIRIRHQDGPVVDDYNYKFTVYDDMGEPSPSLTDAIDDALLAWAEETGNDPSAHHAEATSYSYPT